MKPETERSPAVRLWLEERKANYHESVRFLDRLAAAEFHWFFHQGLQAIRSNLYVPGVSSLLNGIEASLRVTIAQITVGPEISALSPYRVLSNSLI